MGCLKEIFCLLFVAVSIVSAADRNQKPYKVVCYLGSWANYRNGDAKFLIEHIDPFLCTHLVYGFAKLTDNKIAVYDTYLDLKENWGLGAYTRFNDLKKRNPQLSTLIAIGGWNEGSEKYSKMASSPATRAVFIQSVIEFCKKYNFDGLDMDWEYPANRGGVPSDKENFVALLKELKEAFAPHGLLLSAAVSAGKNTMDTAYNIKEVSNHLDFINVMAYDLHGAWESKTGHNAPLYARDDEPEAEKILNVDYAIQYWIDQGADRKKIVLGMGTYGRSFTLADPSNNGIGAPATGKGKAGPLTAEDGMLGYNEICLSLKSGWSEVFVPKIEAPYAYQGNQWVGYDDKKSIGIKTDYIIKNKLAGGMIWSLETDDFRGKCFGEKYPLLKTIAAKLNGEGSVVDPDPLPITKEPPVVRPTEMPGKEFKCTQEGYFRDPYDCSKFYFCVAQGEGEFARHIYSCGENSAFDEKTKTCTFRDQVPECKFI